MLEKYRATPIQSVLKKYYKAIRINEGSLEKAELDPRDYILMAVKSKIDKILQKDLFSTQKKIELKRKLQK